MNEENKLNSGVIVGPQEYFDDVDNISSEDISASALASTGNDNLDKAAARAEERLKALENSEFEISDIKKELSSNEFLPEMQVDQAELISILNITNRVKHGEKFNIYKELPKSIKDKINESAASAGYGDYSQESNEYRNSMASLLINTFISNISINKYAEGFQKEMAEIENVFNTECSKMFLDYNTKRTEYINKLAETAGEGVDKEFLGELADAINDGFALTRLIKAIENHKIKIKPFDIRKPARAFNDFDNKYLRTTQSIHSIYLAHKVLKKHFGNEFSDEDITRFFIAISKFCRLFKPENSIEHAFMYYTMYNILLLDVYKGDQYKQFAPLYRENVRKVINAIHKM